MIKYICVNKTCQNYKVIVPTSGDCKECEEELYLAKESIFGKIVKNRLLLIILGVIMLSFITIILFTLLTRPLPTTIVKNGVTFRYVDNEKEEVRFQLFPFLRYSKDDNLSIYNKKYIETKAPFYIQTTSVTVAQFQKFVNEKKYVTECFSEKQWDKDENGKRTENNPVTNISIKDAKEYANWFSQKSNGEYRLPSVKEWVKTINDKENYNDTENYIFLQEQEPISKKVRSFLGNLYEFSSTKVDGKTLLISSAFNTKSLGKKYFEDRCNQYVTFRLVKVIK